MKKRFSLVLPCIMALSPVFGQINAGPDQTICLGETVSLFAEATGGYGTDSYSFELFPYQPETYSGGTPVTFGGNQDDQIAGPFQLGFQFCFFNQYYSQFYIGSNGWVGFTYSSSWTTYTSAPIPSTSSSVPKNCIMAPWQDWHPGISSSYGPPYVFYKTIGSAPNRKLVVYWNQCPMYSCTTTRGTFQIVLNEQSSIIENHITNKPNCTSWAGGTGTQGVHNSNGSIAFTATGRNSTQWTVTNESTRFVPSGIKWYTGGYPNGTIVSYGPELIVTPSVTTTYTAVVNLCGGQAYTDNVTITVIPQNNAGFSYGSSTLCQNGFSGAPTTSFPGGSYTSTPPGLSINANTGNINLGSSAPGTYYVTHITTGLCPDTATISLSVTLSPSAQFGYPQPGYCVSASNPLPVFVPGSSGGTFSSTPPGLNFVSVFTGEINLATSTPGSYQITNTIPASGGCPQVTHTTTVQIYTLPGAAGNIQGPTNLCENPANSIFTISPASNATAYLWGMAPPAAGVITGSGTSATVNWNDNFAGNAFVQVRAQNACGGGQASPPKQVQINPLPKETSTPAGPAQVCQGTISTDYETSGSAFATHYQWILSPANAGSIQGQGQEISINWAAGFTGQAQLAVRGVNECGESAWSESLTITISPLPLQANQPTGMVFYCAGNNTGTYTTLPLPSTENYQWTLLPALSGSISGQGNSININWNPIFTGTAMLSVAGVNNCGAGPTSPPLQITISALPQLSAGNDSTVTFGATVRLKGIVQPPATAMTYHWEPESMLVNPNELQPFTHAMQNTTLFTFTATETNTGCLSSDEVLIQVAGSPLTATASSSPSTICSGESTTLSVQAYGGDATAYNYSWYENGSLFSFLTNPVVFPNTTTTYEVIVSDGFSTFSTQTTVLVLTLPLADAGSDQYTTMAAPVQLHGSASPAGNYTYQWQPADSLVNANINNPYTLPLKTTNLFSLWVTDENGCVSLSDQTTIFVEGGSLSASPLASPDTICVGSATTLFALPSGGNTAGYSYQWLINGIQLSEQPTVEVSPASTTIYTLVMSDGFNTIERQVKVTVHSLPVIIISAPGIQQTGKDLFVCVYDTLSLILNMPNTDLVWSDGSLHDTLYLWTSGISFDYRPMWVSATNKTTRCSVTEEFNVFFTFTSCSYGIEESDVDNSIQLFPNPAGSWLTIRLQHPEAGGGEIQLFDVFGRLMDKFMLPGSGEHDLTVNISHLPKGIYLVRICTGLSVNVKKLVIGE
ncbi:MAG: T9SS type A sorting domain-containing protein [Lentimicrobium sp.]|nr:T9SS type A sorting domain-containing protein [Lentimicrobium sp.]